MIVRALLALALLAIGFGAGTQPIASAQDATPAAAGDPIVIGAAVHQSDWMAAYDLPPLEGARLAVELINAAGGVLGRPLELIDGEKVRALSMFQATYIVSSEHGCPSAGTKIQSFSGCHQCADPTPGPSPIGRGGWTGGKTSDAFFNARH